MHQFILNVVKLAMLSRTGGEHGAFLFPRLDALSNINAA
jgi:hypothetical protein